MTDDPHNPRLRSVSAFGLVIFISAALGSVSLGIVCYRGNGIWKDYRTQAETQKESVREAGSNPTSPTWEKESKPHGGGDTPTSGGKELRKPWR